MAEPTMRELPSAISTLIMAGDFPHCNPEALFAYWTRPELLCRWWPHEAETDPRLGGTYHLAWPAMNWHLRGRYIAIAPERRLAFTWAWDHEPDAPERQVDITFAPGVEGDTRLTITHGPYGDSDAERASRAGNIEGWQHFCAKLTALLDEDGEDVAAWSR